MLDNGIVSTFYKRMAAQQAPGGHQPPRMTPKRSTASTAYSEQVGTYRQEGGSNGEITHLYALKQIQRDRLR